MAAHNSSGRGFRGVRSLTLEEPPGQGDPPELREPDTELAALRPLHGREAQGLELVYDEGPRSASRKFPGGRSNILIDDSARGQLLPEVHDDPRVNVCDPHRN